MSDGLGIGIVGCGFVAREHHALAIAAAGLAVRAVFDPDRAAAAGVAERCGNRVSVADSLEEMLADSSIDAFVICTPPAAHLEPALAALKAGRHVLIEKPLSLSLADCDRLIAARDDAGVVAAVGFNLRCHENVLAAQTLPAGATPAQALSLAYEWVGPAHDAGPWAREDVAGGNLMMERGSHMLDLVPHLAAQPATRVSARSAKGGIAIALELGSSRTATISMLGSTASAHRLRWAGTEGGAELDLHRFDGLRELDTAAVPATAAARIREMVRAPGKLPAALRAARAGGVFRSTYVEQWRRFGAAVAGQGRPAATLEDGRAALAAVLAALQSVREERPVAIGDSPATLREALA